MKAFITGANKGIGYGIAQALGRRGYELYIGARDEQRGQDAVSRLTGQGYAASFIKLDLADFDTIHAAAEAVTDLDLLINNAGIAGNIATDTSRLDMGKSPLAYTTADLRETIETNFLGTHEVIKSFLPALSEDARILNVTVPVTATFWQPLAYVTSKAAQNVMTIAFGREFEKSGSRRQIFGVMPGAVATDLNGTSVGDHGGMVKSTEDAAENIVGFLFDGKNHNGHIVQFDGKEVTSYEHDLFG
ncbi:SDR family NAD(P)-dependent oxidoreductase [Curtobacterium ammoniigenes]|uniref:SDR family NAD(P)-dependent oxidoreductase n=1 Tax=Curtobacterium ammoniigenes TaxID=395387 RepID=UPI00082FFBF9|nr:SDR family NAD(P)-dependent oxidoreductase [Curtobacterium ammoniigenes]